MRRGGLRYQGGRSGCGLRGRSGFSLIELVVVLLVTSVTLGIGIASFQAYYNSSATRRAAELFVHDLATARATAIRERSSVTIAFNEAARSYEIRTSEGRLLLARSFAPGSEISLTVLALEVAGDSIVFSPRGVVDLSGVVGSLGVARFEAGERSAFATFNALGAAEVEGF